MYVYVCVCVCVCMYFGCTEYSLWHSGFSSFAVSRCGLSSCSACAWSQLLSSPTRDPTWTPCIGSMESHPLDHKYHRPPLPHQPADSDGQPGEESPHSLEDERNDCMNDDQAGLFLGASLLCKNLGEKERVSDVV